MMSHRFHHIRGIVYVAAIVSGLVGILVCLSDGIEKTLVQSREFLGLWALGLLLASMMLGPIVALIPKLPFRSHILYARRAVGVSACGFAIAHVACYLPSPLRRGWHELYTPGPLWAIGLLLGVTALCIMVSLAVTSRDAAIKRMGGRRWKRLHRLTYPLLAIVLLHALSMGADFWVNRGPDVDAAADAGALIGFACLSAAWIVLFALRWHRTRSHSNAR